MNKLVRLLFFSAFISLAAQSVFAAESVMSFKEWKSEKIQASIKEISLLRIQMGRDADLRKDLKQQMSQAKWRLESIKELTISDYVSRYLVSLKRKDRFLKAAAKMQKDEVAALIAELSTQMSSDLENLAVKAPTGSQRPAATYLMPVQANSERLDMPESSK